MRHIVLYTALSLDGCIARPNGNIDWLESVGAIPDEDYGYNEFYNRIDTTLMGYRTYAQILGFDMPFPYPDKTNYIFSRSGNRQDTVHVKFISGDIVAFARQLKDAEGEDIWLIGGGQINGLFLSHQLIDRMIITIIPVTIGEGIPLFREPTGDTWFEIADSKTYSNGIVQLTYKTSQNH